MMRTIKNVLFTFFVFFFYSTQISAQKQIDTILLKELTRMFKVDQIASVKGKKSSTLSKREWADSVFRTHKKFIEKILDKSGFPGYDRLGKRGSRYYFTFAQHSDFDPNFQKRVLDSMYKQVQLNNADPRNYAYLMDRVNMNKGKKLVYGTQVKYHWFTGNASYKPTIDPENLNKRRAEIGLEPIEEYLKEMKEVNDSVGGNSFYGGISNVGVFFIIVLVFLIGLILLVIKRKSGFQRT